jgi:hypothetical protein
VFVQIEFPEDLRVYAEKTLENWQRENTGAVALLTAQPGDDAFGTVPADRRNDTWNYNRQDAAAGKIYHIWRNAAGDEMAFEFNNPAVVPRPANGHHLVLRVVFTAAT